MKILKEHIEDLKVIQSGYPNNSRGYEALRLAIVVLTQVYDGEAVATPANHWVAGEGAGSVNGSVSAPAYGTITVAPGEAWFTYED